MSPADGDGPPLPPDGGGLPPDGEAAAGGAKDRWWVETGEKKRERPQAPAPTPVGSRFYRAGAGFEQDAARKRLTDLNLKLLIEANPENGEWGYVQLAEKPHPERERERIKEQLALPPYARAVMVDCGRSVRVLATGTPIGARVLDLTLGENPSFDCWIDGEWVRERVFRDNRSAINAMRRYIVEYLSPEGIAAWEALRARV
jgi:hypothetical protein